MQNCLVNPAPSLACAVAVDAQASRFLGRSPTPTSLTLAHLASTIGQVAPVFILASLMFNFVMLLTNLVRVVGFHGFSLVRIDTFRSFRV